MTDVQDTMDTAAKALTCPQCGSADHVQKISAIPDWPAEYGPRERPRSIEFLLDAVLLVLAALWVALIAANLWYGTPYDLERCRMGVVLLPLVPFLVGYPRLASRRRQKAQWEEGMSRWESLYFCPRDEVAFTPERASPIPLAELRDFLYADQEELTDRAAELEQLVAPEPERFADFSPMPEEFGDFARRLEQAKEKSGTLICYECGHDNPVGQTQCEECGAWVPQTAKARWTDGRDK